MNNEKTSLEIVEGIYDIQPLIPDAFSTLDIVIVSILTMTLLSYIIRRYYFSTKGQAKRNITKLQKQYAAQVITQHKAIYTLCSLLQSGLKVKQLNDIESLPASLFKDAKYEKKWLFFQQQLTTLRYKQNRTSENLDAVFLESLYWLKVWP